MEPERPPLDDLERRLGVTVRRKDLLELALIHHSSAEIPDEGAPA